MNYEPFDYEKYKAGRKAVTRDGREVTQLVMFEISNARPYRGAIEGSNEIYSWDKDGRYYTDIESQFDLFLLPEVREVWVAVDEEHRDFEIAGDEQETEWYILSRKRYKKAKLIIYS